MCKMNFLWLFTVNDEGRFTKYNKKAAYKLDCERKKTQIKQDKWELFSSSAFVSFFLLL